MDKPLAQEWLDWLLNNEEPIIKQVRDFGYCELEIERKKRTISNQEDYNKLVKEFKEMTQEKTKVLVSYGKIIHDGQPLQKAHEDDAAYDIRANISGILKPGESMLVPTGIYMALAPGYEFQVRPRSGMALKNKVTVLNSPGTIDSGYRGECGVILINHGDKAFSFSAGDRIAQGVVSKLPDVELEQVDALPESARGTGGFGSTGKQ
jgi:dUTP pyrophosphatase